MVIKYAKVTEVTDNDFKVTFLGEAIQSEMSYFKLATYSPTVEDMVAFIVDSKGKYLCLGKVE